VSLVLLLGGVACWLLLPPRPTSGVTRANYKAIRERMTQVEVEAILGGPAGNYTTRDVDPLPERSVDAASRLGFLLRGQWWMGDEGNVWIIFDETTRVIEAEFEPMRLKSPPLRVKLRRWLGIAGEGE
jgi:hypothetical protein